jgi:hypothetical protein
MTIKIIYQPYSSKIDKTFSVVIAALTQKLANSDAMLTSSEIIPLVKAMFASQLAGLSTRLDNPNRTARRLI